MISRVLSAELAEHAGRRVTIAGWVHRRRRLKSVSFLVVRDRAGLAMFRVHRHSMNRNGSTAE